MSTYVFKVLTSYMVSVEWIVMGLDAQEAGGSLVHMEGAQVSKI